MRTIIIAFIACTSLTYSVYGQTTYTGIFTGYHSQGMGTDQWFNLLPNGGATSVNNWNVYHKDGGSIFQAHYGAAQPYVQIGASRTTHFFVNGVAGVGITSPMFQTKFGVFEAGSSATTWRGRIVSSGETSAVVMGEYNGKACIGAHVPALNAWSDLILQFDGGNTGIGTITPSQKLTVSGNILENAENSAIGLDAQSNARLGFIKKIGYGPVIASDNGTPIIFSQTNQTGVHTNIAGATLTERMRVDYKGDIGIGTMTPDSKLTVNGTTHAKQVKIDLTVPGPDYVFEKDYQLPSLEQVKSYIDQNKHLPEVPSAREMEANGVNLGEMNMLLLKKVEELTLHLIKMKEENEKFKELALEMEDLKSQMEIIKKALK